MARTITKREFRGFCTSNLTASDRRNSALYDMELIRQDLLNHFHTRIGERFGRPDFGCRIWDYLMEPFTTAIRDAIAAEVERICRFDERLEVEGIEVTELESGIQVSMNLIHRFYRVTETFSTNFEQRQT